MGVVNGEPYFTLKASDSLAPHMLREWARLQILQNGDNKTAADAEVLALEMDKYQLALKQTKKQEGLVNATHNE